MSVWFVESFDGGDLTTKWDAVVNATIDTGQDRDPGVAGNAAQVEQEPQRQNLPGDMAARRVDELGQEGQHENTDLRVQEIDQGGLAKDM